MFEIVSPNARLINLNHRTEMEGEDFVTAFDLRIECEATAEVAGFLMGALEHSHAPDLWTKNGDIKYHGMLGDIRSTAEFWDCQAQFKDVTMREVRVNKFSFHPIPGKQIRLTLRLQLRPDDRQMVKLSHYQKKGGRFVVKAEHVYAPYENYQLEI